MLGLAVTGQKMLEEGESATPGCGDDLAAIGVDDCEWPMVSYGFSEDRVETLLIGGNEGSSLGIAIRIEYSFNQPLVGDFACSGELAAL